MAVKADLHMHGPIGFQPYWLKEQKYWGKNLLQLIADECFSKGIGICAITSHADKIEPFSVQDRFGLLKTHEIKSLPRAYSADTLDKNLIIVQNKDGKITYLVNGQTVMPCEYGKKYDMLVVGSNQVPNGMTLADTLNYCKDRGLIKIAEHDFIQAHNKRGLRLFEKHIDDFDAIEGHNAQSSVPNWMGSIPRIGKKFAKASERLNEEATQAGYNFDKSRISVSDAHRIEDLGIAGIILTEMPKTDNEDHFLKDLRYSIRTEAYKNFQGNEPFFSWLGWARQFNKGIYRPDQDKEVYLPSHLQK